MAAGGEVIALDTAGYGANVTITKSVSILIPDGIYGAITTASGNAITINAGTTDIVRIKGLNLVGAGTSGSGIVVNSGGFVYIDEVTVRNFNTNTGIYVGGPTDAFISNSRVRDGDYGIDIDNVTIGAPGGSHKALITNCKVENMKSEGIGSSSHANVTVRDTVVSHAGNAFKCSSTIPNVLPELTLEHCLATYSSSGVYALNGGVIRMTGCTIIGNNYGIYNDSSTIFSWSDNNVHGSVTADVTGTHTPLTKY